MAIIKVLIKKNSTNKFIEVKTIILEIISVVLRPLRENPDWIDNNFLGNLGDYLVDEVWNLTALKKIKKGSDNSESGGDQNSQSHESNLINFSKSESKCKKSSELVVTPNLGDRLSPSKFLNTNKPHNLALTGNFIGGELLPEIELDFPPTKFRKTTNKMGKKSLQLDTNLINLTSQITFQMPKSVAIACEKSFNIDASKNIELETTKHNSRNNLDSFILVQPSQGKLKIGIDAGNNPPALGSSQTPNACFPRSNVRKGPPTLNIGLCNNDSNSNSSQKQNPNTQPSAPQLDKLGFAGAKKGGIKMGSGFLTIDTNDDQDDTLNMTGPLDSMKNDSTVELSMPPPGMGKGKKKPGFSLDTDIINDSAIIAKAQSFNANNNNLSDKSGLFGGPTSGDDLGGGPGLGGAPAPAPAPGFGGAGGMRRKKMAFMEQKG